jgi:hypothetical protein
MALMETIERDPALYLLADHLAAALTIGEELFAERLALDTPAGKSPLRNWMRHNRDLTSFLTTVRTLEYAMTARLLQARRRAEELKRSEAQLRPLIALFVAGTAPLVDAAEELGDADTRNFNSTDATLTFLRSRGLLAMDTAGLEGHSGLVVTEDYQVAHRIRLGTLLELVATFREVLMVDLYGEVDDGFEAEEPTVPETTSALLDETNRHA